MRGKRFTLKERMNQPPIILDNGIDLPQSCVCDLLNKYEKENEELKSIKSFANHHKINVSTSDIAFTKCWNDNAKLTRENERLRKECQDKLMKQVNLINKDLTVIMLMLLRENIELTDREYEAFERLSKFKVDY